MKVRMVEVEGSPEELRQFDIHEFLGESSNGESIDPIEEQMVVAPEALSLLTLAPSTVAVQLRRFLLAVGQWGNVAVGIGGATHSDGKPRYLTVHRVPKRFGAFVYVHPRTGKLTFRLNKTHLEGTKFAKGRNVKDDSTYQIVVFLKNDESMEEALALAKVAYEQVD